MPAPDFETIYDVEGAFEPAVKAAIQTSGLVAAVQREAGELAPVRVDVQFSLGAEKTTRAVDKLGNRVTTAWEGQLLLRVVTPRYGQPDANGNPLPFDPAAHGRIRAKLRHLLQNSANAFSTLMPFHVLTQILATGSSPQLEAEDDQDVSELAYACIISVRQNAWPLAPV